MLYVFVMCVVNVCDMVVVVFLSFTLIRLLVVFLMLLLLRISMVVCGDVRGSVHDDDGVFDQNRRLRRSLLLLLPWLMIAACFLPFSFAFDSLLLPPAIETTFIN